MQIDVVNPEFMCGIVGYIGNQEVFSILITGLHRLEYFGYDSAGVALQGSDVLNVYKSKGKVNDFAPVTGDKDCSGIVGIAHTRSETHGELYL